MWLREIYGACVLDAGGSEAGMGFFFTTLYLVWYKVLPTAWDSRACFPFVHDGSFAPHVFSPTQQNRQFPQKPIFGGGWYGSHANMCGAVDLDRGLTLRDSNRFLLLDGLTLETTRKPFQGSEEADDCSVYVWQLQHPPTKEGRKNCYPLPFHELSRANSP